MPKTEIQYKCHMSKTKRGDQAAEAEKIQKGLLSAEIKGIFS